MGDLHPEWEEWVASIRSASAASAPSIIGRGAEKWKEEGRGRFKCCSPLRKERTPSFYVYPDGTWHDFGTGEGGDLIAFVQRRDRSTFKEALEALASELGIPSWEEKRKGRGGPQLSGQEMLALWDGEAEKRRVKSHLSEIVHLCHALLPSKVREHLSDRGLSPDFVDMEKIGWVPAGLYDLCSDWLEISDEDLLKTGMFVKIGEEISPAMTHRILFPYWRDGLPEYTIGREHHFGFREEDVHLEAWEKGRKYKKHLTRSEKFPYVSPHVGHDLLWGEDCQRFASKERSLLLIEGITDAAIAKLLDFHVVSPVTTNIPGKMLERVVSLAKKWKEIVILNDDEENKSGQKGAIREGLALWAAGVPVRVGTVPRRPGEEKADVNSHCVRALEEGRAAGDEDPEARARRALEALVDAAEPLPSYLVDVMEPSWPLGEIEEWIVEKLAQVAVRMTVLQRGDLVEKLVRRYPKAPKRDLRRAFDAAVAKGVAAAKAGKAKAEADEKPEAEKEPKKPAAKLRGQISEDIGSYDRMFSDGQTERVSTFSLVLVRTVAQDDGPAVLVCRVLGAMGEALVSEWAIPPKAWHSKRAFVANFPVERMQWMGSDDEVQSVYEILTRGGVGHVPRVKGVDVLGYHEVEVTVVNGVESKKTERRFVLPSGTLDESGDLMAEPDLVYVPEGGSNLQTRLFRSRDGSLEQGRRIAEEAVSKLLLIQTPDVAIPVAAWFAAAAFKPRLAATLGGFPILNIYGTAGSGKTSMVKSVYWPLFAGVKMAEPLSSTQTIFVIVKDCASTNAIPLPYDEYKPVDMGSKADWFRRMLRRIWAGESEGRGHQDQSMSVYFLRAPTAVMGETRLDDDAAIVERCLYAHPSKNWLDQNASAQEAFHSLLERPLWRAAPVYQGWSLSADFDAMLSRARATDAGLREAMGLKLAPQRVKANLVALAFGWEALSAFAASLGGEASRALAGADFEGAYRAAVREILDVEVAQGGTTDAPASYQVRDAVDHLVVDASCMANTGRLEEGTHYSYVDGRLFLYLKAVDGEIAVWRRERGLPVTSPGHRALLRVAKEKEEGGSSYIVSHDHRMRMGAAGYVRGILIQTILIPRSLGADEFPCRVPRSWGVTRQFKLPGSDGDPN